MDRDSTQGGRLAASDPAGAGARIAELESQLARLASVLLRVDGAKGEDEAVLHNSVFEDAPIGIYVSTPQGRYVRINPAMASLLGYASPEQAIREIANIGESTYVHPGDRLTIGRLLQEHGQIVNHEVQRIRRDGTAVWVSQNMRAVKDEDGRVLFFVGYAVNIDSTKLAEEALRASEQSLSDLYNYAPVGIIKSTPQGRYVMANDAMARMLGYERGHDLVTQITDMARQTYFDPHDRDKMRRQLEEKDALVGFEICRKRKDGSPIWLSHNWRTVRDAAGKIVHYEGFALDISERKAMEIRFREEGAIFRAILRGISTGIVTIDPRTDIIVDVNSVAAEILGRPKAKLKGASSQSITWICLEGKSQETSCNLSGEHRFIATEMLIERGDKTRVPVMRTTIAAHRGGSLFIFEVIFDITRHKNLERQLLLSQKLESIGQLAAGVAHEINTPIQYVGDNLHFIKDSFLKTIELLDACGQFIPAQMAPEMEEKKRDFDYGFLREETPKALEQSIEGVNRVAAIVSAMKRFSHPGVQDRSYTDLNADVENTLIVTRNEWKYVAEVDTNLDRSLPPVYCHPMEINQVIVNIIVNAAHAIAEKLAGTDAKGRIGVRTSRDGDFVTLRISDTGCGIPEANRNKVYDPFFTTKEVGKGTGQGLAMSHHIIVDKHGGTIDFESRPGEGTTFTIRLPLGEAPAGGTGS